MNYRFRWFLELRSYAYVCECLRTFLSACLYECVYVSVFICLCVCVVSVVGRRPRGASQYAILSSEGVTQVWAGQVTFTSMDDFRREVNIYTRLTKVGTGDATRT